MLKVVQRSVSRVSYRSFPVEEDSVPTARAECIGRVVVCLPIYGARQIGLGWEPILQPQRTLGARGSGKGSRPRNGGPTPLGVNSRHIVTTLANIDDFELSIRHTSVTSRHLPSQNPRLAAPDGKQVTMRQVTLFPADL
jgi:hypothetical protein